jgi:hypothetical protein
MSEGVPLTITWWTDADMRWIVSRVSQELRLDIADVYEMDRNQLIAALKELSQIMVTADIQPVAFWGDKP